MPQSNLYNCLFVLIGFLYPLYCTLVAVETITTKDDIAWLMYWAVFAVFNILVYFTDFLVGFFPFYSFFKLGFLFWCVFPIGSRNGAYIIYQLLIRPIFSLYH